MNAQWRRTLFYCSHDLTELLSDRLLGLGAQGVETVDKQELAAWIERPGSLDYASDAFIAALPEMAVVRAWFESESSDEPIKEPSEASSMIQKSKANFRCLQERVLICGEPSFLSGLYESMPDTAISLEELDQQLTLLAREVEEAGAFLAAPFGEALSSVEDLNSQRDGQAVDSSANQSEQREGTTWICRYGGADWSEEKDWESEWKSFYSTIHESPRLVVNPSWLTYEAKPGEKVLHLDPGSAFGTGYHETTALCLAALDQRQAMDPEGFQKTKMLDLGTGSGILAIAACLLGCRQVIGCDVDPQTLPVARENARQNGIPVGKQEQEKPALTLRQGTLDSEDTDYDLILANLVADLHLKLASQYREHLSPDGQVVLSGIVDPRKDEVDQKMREEGFHLYSASYLNGWWILSYKNR